MGYNELGIFKTQKRFSEHLLSMWSTDLKLKQTEHAFKKKRIYLRIKVTTKLMDIKQHQSTTLNNNLQFTYTITEAHNYFWSIITAKLYDKTWNPSIFSWLWFTTFNIVFVLCRLIRLKFITRWGLHNQLTMTVREESVLLTFFCQDTGHHLQIHLSLDHKRCCGGFDKHIYFRWLFLYCNPKWPSSLWLLEEQRLHSEYQNISYQDVKN